MVLTDNELGMIEQLTYMDHRVAEQAGIQGFSGIKSGQKNMKKPYEIWRKKGTKRLGFLQRRSGPV